MLAFNGAGVKKTAVAEDSSPAVRVVQGKGLAWQDW
jgi:hypothetical protein